MPPETAAAIQLLKQALAEDANKQRLRAAIDQLADQLEHRTAQREEGAA